MPLREAAFDSSGGGTSTLNLPPLKLTNEIYSVIMNSRKRALLIQKQICLPHGYSNK